MNKFLQDPTAPIKARADLYPNAPFPERGIDFKDIAMGADAFAVPSVYAALFFGPCTCPSSVPCDTISCALDLDCGDSFCVDGFCTDECGRCAP